MTAYRRQLNIRRHPGDIGKKPVNLVLSFQVPDPKQLFKTQFSINWKTALFTGEGNEFLEVTYINQLLVANPQVDNGTNIRPTIWVEITPGERTALVQQGSGFTFTPPETQSVQLITAENKTGIIVDFAIGYVDEKRRPTPLVMFPDIGDKSSISTQFFPILQAFITSGYAEGDVLRGAIEETNASPFWTQDLRPLRDVSDWTFERDPISGSYNLTRDLSKIE